MIQVAMLPDMIRRMDRSATTSGLGNSGVIVVDTLRASTSIITALESGAEAVVPVSSIDEAHAEAIRRSGQRPLLAGERGGIIIEGFDLGNSPAEFSPRHVQGKTIIMATSNGTKAIQHCADARTISIGSLLNAEAVARHFSEQAAVSDPAPPDRLVIVCAGTEGVVSQDDVIGAGSIVAQMLEIDAALDVDDAGLCALDVYLAHRANLEEGLRRTAHGRRLLNLGFEKDISRASDLNGSRTLPVFRNGEIRDASGEPKNFLPPADTGT